MLIEFTRQVHQMLHTEANLGIRPAVGSSFTQAETGVTIRRLTDCPNIISPYSSSFQTGYTTPKSGLHNGYSRFPCTNLLGDYILAFGTTPLAVVLEVIEETIVNRGVFVTPVGTKIGDLNELKWSSNPTIPYRVFYTHGNKTYSLDIRGGSNPQEECVWSAPFKHTSDGDFSMGGRYLAMALTDGSVEVYDLVERKRACRVPDVSTSGVDVSPNGKWLKINNHFYDVATGLHVTSNGSGHGGWVIGKDGRNWFVNQHSSIDWIVAFDPENNEYWYLMRMEEIGGGIHVASDKWGRFPGWALVSTYGGTSALSNQVFFLELRSQKNPGIKHPSFGGTLEAFQQGDVPLEMRPRVLRVCPMWNTYLSGAYFTEGFASVGHDYNVYWGSNWMGTRPMDLYRAELTAEMKQLMGVASNPQPEPEPEPIPVTVTKSDIIYATATNRVFQSNDSLSSTTLTATNAHAVTGFVGGRTGGEFDQSVLFFIPLDGLPEDINIMSASLVLNTCPEQQAYVANNREGAAIRRVMDKDWQPAYRDVNNQWRGASWQNCWQEDVINTRWSELPTKAQYGRTGDLSTVLETISDATPRINFPTKPGMAIVDITQYVKSWYSGEVKNCGFYLDISNLINQVVNNTTRTVRVGVRGHKYLVTEERPRIVVTYEQTILVPPTGTEPEPEPEPEIPPVEPEPEPSPDWVIRTITLKPGERLIVDCPLPNQ